MKRYSLLSLVVCLGLLPAVGQNSRSDGVVFSRNGFPAPAASVAVCSPVAITAASEVIGTVTITSTLNPAQGSTVQIVGMTPTQYNGSYTVLTTSGTNFTYTNPTQGLGAGTVFGTALVVSTTPCSPLAPLCASFTDTTCSSSNPVTADGLGNYSFYVKPGRYTTQFYGSGLTARLQPDQVLSCDPSTSCTLTGPITITGTLTAQSVNGNLWVGTGGYATIGACLAALGSQAGTCWIAPNNANGTYSETLSSAITWPSKNNVSLIATVPATITGPASSACLTIPAGNIGATIQGMPMGTNGFPGGGTSALAFNCTPTAGNPAIQVGTSSTATQFVTLRNVEVNISGAVASAQGINLARVVTSEFSNFSITGGGGTQKCLVLDGTGGFTGQNEFRNSAISSCQILAQLNNSSNNNAFTGFSKWFTSTASGIGLDIESGDGNHGDLDIENTPTAFKFNSANDRVNAYIGGNTTDFLFTASSAQNYAGVQGGIGAGADPVVSDSGTNNTVSNPHKFKVDSSGNMTLSGNILATGSIAAGGVQPGVAGDIAAARSATAGAVYIGSDGTVQFFRISGTLQLLNANFQIPNGTITNYNGLATAGTGVAPNLGTPVNLTGQVANLGATTIYTTAASGAGSAGLYRVCAAAWTTSTGNSTVTINAIAPSGAGTVTAPLPQTLNTAAVTNPGGGCTVLGVAASSAIQVSVTGYNTTGTYSIKATTEQLM